MKKFNRAIQDTMKLLKSCRHFLTVQQFKVLKSQCLSGDIIGARKGLQTILKKDKK